MPRYYFHQHLTDVGLKISEHSIHKPKTNLEHAVMSCLWCSSWGDRPLSANRLPRSHASRHRLASGCLRQDSASKPCWLRRALD
jgi:hypothetical protein